MKRLALFCCIVSALLSFIVLPCYAVGPGKAMEWDASASSGKVSVEGTVHAEKGVKCTDCHTKIWPMRKGSSMKMEEMNAGKYCGVCHNGEKAFSTKDDASCTKCHQKK